MSERARSFDWGKTPLGPRSSWPESLVTAADLALSSALPAAILWGPKHVQICNDEYLELFGPAGAELLGRPFADSFLLAFPAVEEAFRTAQRGQACSVDNQRMFVQRGRSHDPEEAFFNLSFSPIPDERGHVSAIFHCATETTGRVLAERRMLALHDLLVRTSRAESVSEVSTLFVHTIAEHALDVPFALIYLFDRGARRARLIGSTSQRGAASSSEHLELDTQKSAALMEAALGGRVIARDELVETFGVPAAEVPGSACVLALGPASNGEVTGFLLAGVNPKQPLDQAYRDFYESLARTLTLALGNAGAIERAQALVRREAEQADRRKDEFLAMLAHELRNPLAPIRTALHILKCREPNGLNRHLQIIDRQTENLTRLVDDLLDVSRITRGKIELRRELVDLSSVMSRALDSLKSLFERRKLQVSVTLPSRAPFVLGDPVRLEQVVVNLLTNAAKYTQPSGRIWVTLAQRRSVVELRVRDDGIGITPEMLPRIFNLFEQAQQTLDRAQGGLGIGLTLVRSLVALHGGEVYATSAGVGKGSEFVVQLPSAEAHGDAVDDHAREPSPSLVDPDTGLRVLVVDDNVDAAETIADLLQTTGHEVRVCHTGPSAIELTAEFRPDVVLLDIGLPQMDGYEVARTLRHTHADPPVLVALTGYGQESDRQQSRDAGFAEHLVKPVRLETLLAVLDRCAAGQRAAPSVAPPPFAHQSGESTA